MTHFVRPHGVSEVRIDIERRSRPRGSRRSINVDRCLDCQYYDRRIAKAVDSRTPTWGQCRRHSPRLNPANAKAYFIEGVWPLVREDDWCGEHKIRRHAVPDLASRGAQWSATAMAHIVPPGSTAAVAAGDD